MGKFVRLKPILSIFSSKWFAIASLFDATGNYLTFPLTLIGGLMWGGAPSRVINYYIYLV